MQSFGRCAQVFRRLSSRIRKKLVVERMDFATPLATLVSVLCDVRERSLGLLAQCNVGALVVKLSPMMWCVGVLLLDFLIIRLRMQVESESQSGRIVRNTSDDVCRDSQGTKKIVSGTL